MGTLLWRGLPYSTSGPPFDPKKITILSRFFFTAQESSILSGTEEKTRISAKLKKKAQKCIDHKKKKHFYSNEIRESPLNCPYTMIIYG